MNEFKEKLIRIASLPIFLVIMVALVTYAYLVSPIFKKAKGSFLSLTGKDTKNGRIASAVCVPGQENQDDETFFVSCGGIF